MGDRMRLPLGVSLSTLRSRLGLVVLLFLLPVVLLPQLLRTGVGDSLFHGHGYCYLWDTRLVTLHVSSDALIALSYLSISLTLALFVARERSALPFHWMFLA